MVPGGYLVLGRMHSNSNQNSIKTVRQFVRHVKIYIWSLDEKGGNLQVMVHQESLGEGQEEDPGLE